MHSHFVMFSAYNRWANETLYDAAAALSDEEYRRTVGAYFGSMHGTLNHILVADRVWMKRFTGQGEHPNRLDAVLHENFADLQAARRKEDERIAAYVDSLDEAALEGHFTFTMITRPETTTARLSPMLAHFFNHQTHHRGQAHTILSLLGKAPPSLDLVYFARSEAGKRFA